MPYYKDNNNKIFFYDDTKEMEKFNSGLLEITNEEKELIINNELTDSPIPSTQELGAYIRSERNNRALCAIDAKSKYERELESINRGIIVGNPMIESDYVLVLQYLQDLFDIPDKDSFPWDGPEDPLCPWPTKPDCVYDTSIG